MRKHLIIRHALIFALLAFSLSCGAPANTAELRNTDSPGKLTTTSSVPKKSGIQTLQVLCDRVSEIKRIPFEPDERGEDATYDALVDAGDAIVPCLISKVTDTTSMPDPRMAPRYPDIDNKVGDVALWVLLHIAKLDLLDFLPPIVRKEFENEGVYAYFDYVKKDENRVKLQGRFFDWYRQKYGKDALERQAHSSK